MKRAQITWFKRQEFSIAELLGGSEEMEDVKTLFEVNKDREITIVTTGDRGFSGKVENAQDNHVLFKCEDGTYCIFYQNIICVKLG